MHTTSLRTRAFSLIELIVVISVLAIIAAFSVPAVTSMLQGSSLTQASQLLVDQMNLARQLALSKNTIIEVRFYRYGDPDSPGEDVTKPEEGKFRAMQLFEVLSNGAALPIGKFEEFPNSITLAAEREKPDSGISSLLDKGSLKTQDDLAKTDPYHNSAPELPKGIKKQYEFVSFRFMPDGSTTLGPTSLWFITMHGINDRPKSKDGKVGPPDNFFTLQVDPVTGATKIFRPVAG
jgi:uncharacterized protein (TIGR02596 family)